MTSPTDLGVRLQLNPLAGPAAPVAVAAGLGESAARGVREFHRTIPEYEPTPLVELEELAERVGVARVFVKDEARRFGLGSFKGLGAAWAMARVAERADRGARTVVTATDGNHGRALAWAASRHGFDAVVYLPGEASDGRVEAIAALGARTERVAGSYDDAVARAASDADRHGWFLVQDTAWEGYEEIPRWIMQGYLTLIDEALEQLGAGTMPTHVFLQCGVGSFAGAIAGHLVQRRGARRPSIFVVEPVGAACGWAALAAGLDEPPLLPDPPATFMACLSCARLSRLGWEILRHHADGFIVCDDEIARHGMRALAAATRPIVSGESGAVTAGMLSRIAAPGAANLRGDLGLDAGSRVLLVSTEGATDPRIYRDVVGADT